MTKNDILNTPLAKLESKYSFIRGFFEEGGLDEIYNSKATMSEIASSLTEEQMLDLAIDKESLLLNFQNYFDNVVELLGLNEEEAVKSITILAGTHKDGQKENFEQITINLGEVVSIVGPTGSGKSRLLADIEWAADRDTPTKRAILVNGAPADKKVRFSNSHKLVAQLSQNMNFVMDLSVYEFLQMHAMSRMVEDKDTVIEKIFVEANKLAGEKFSKEQSITTLSGGQSRALMIADTAILSKSPIVLIDEIENAGINRKKALDLLLSEDKIVLMATHDPILALMADKRIIISSGGIKDIIVTSSKERALLEKLNRLDDEINQYRQDLRYGKILQ